MFVALLSTSSCVGLPYDSMRIATRTTPIDFAGSAAVPSSTNDVQFLDRQSGSFVSTYQYVSSNAPFDVDGIPVYLWGSADTGPQPIPAWAWRDGTLSGAEAIMRVESDRWNGGRALLQVEREDTIACYEANGRDYLVALDRCMGGTSPEVRIRTTNFADRLVGDPTCSADSEFCQACVEDVEGSFADLRLKRSDRYEARVHNRSFFRPPGDDPANWGVQAHVQGVARLGGAADGEFFFSRNSRKRATPGIYEASYGTLRERQASLARQFLLTRERPSARVINYQDVPASDHLGGIDAEGRFLFVSQAGNGNIPQVLIYDTSDPSALNDAEPTSRIVLGERPEIPGLGDTTGEGCSYVAAQRLIDGTYLVYVGGRGEGTGTGYWFQSDRPEISRATVWNYIDIFCGSNSSDISACVGRESYVPAMDVQGAALVSECGTGRLYLMHHGSMKGDDSLIELLSVDHRLGMSGHPEVQTSSLSVRSPNTHGDGRVSLRWGGAVYVNRDHKLLLYVAQRRPQTGLGVAFVRLFFAPVEYDLFEFSN